MSEDVSCQSPQNRVLNYSIVSSDEEENRLVLKLKVSERHKVPVVVLQRLENVDQYQVSLRTSRRQRKVKQFEEYELDMAAVTNVNTVSPRKRLRPRKPESEMGSPPKVRRSLRTSKKIVNLDFYMDELCESITDSVSLKTPVKKSTRPSRQARPQSPMDVDENDVVLSGKRVSRTPQRYSNATPRSVRVNLDESFRRSVLKSRHMSENVRNTPMRTARTPAKKSHVQKLFSEDEEIEVVNSPKRNLRAKSNSISSDQSSESDESLSNTTPKKTGRTPGNRKQSGSTPKSVQKTPSTSKGRLKMLRDGTITPSMQPRKSCIPECTTPLMKARTQLHVSYVPASLPCREKEYLDVYKFLRGKIDDGCGGCMYISGVPGTGKTATVTSVIDSLTNDKTVGKFSFVSINGMRLTEPKQSYVEIWKQLTGKTVAWAQACSLLEERFTKVKKLHPVVMLVDELDILCTKRQDVVYNLLDWPTKSKDPLIVITIANTMDLPERLLMSRVTSRLGLTRLTFQAYTHKQLIEIVTRRLTGTDSFDRDAIQLVARKVASVSGDARRALDICRRAAEIAERDGNEQQVSIQQINDALTAMITQPQVTAIKRSSRLQKLLLQAIVAEVERTGVEETTFVDVFKVLASCCALDGFKMVSSTIAQRALSRLGECKLVITDQKCNNIYQRIILNVSVHDVYFALKKQ
ncbi:hypothetical protein HUJ04_013202 [Dendroctonus ponderosae]